MNYLMKNDFFLGFRVNFEGLIVGNRRSSIWLQLGMKLLYCTGAQTLWPDHEKLNKRKDKNTNLFLTI